jgi:hypothetical protein
VLEEELDAGVLGRLDEQAVDGRARDGVVDLGRRDAVGLREHLAVLQVHRALLHRHAQIERRLQQADLGEGVEAARGEN